jgi:hypothetical protein
MSKNNNRNTFRDYDTFNGKGTARLRAHNRLITFYSVFGDLSLGMAQEYIKQFDASSRADIQTMAVDLRTDFGGTRRELAQGNEYEEA